MQLNLESSGPPNIPDWANIFGYLAGLLGINKIVENWQKFRQDKEEKKDEKIKRLEEENMELRLINEELSKGQGELREQLKGVKKAVRAIIEMSTDKATRDALLTSLENEDNE